ncbi:hypothetical protein PMAYCL1PPCAC_19259, partial [Pristionchus mayeri]
SSSNNMSRLFLLPLLFILISPSKSVLRLGDTVDGVVDELRPTVNGLLQTVHKILPLGIRLKRDLNLGDTVDGLRPTVNGLLGTVDNILPLGIRLKRELNLGQAVDGIVDALRPPVNGLLQTVDGILTLGIRRVR